MYVNFKPEFAEKPDEDFSLSPAYAEWTEEAVQKIPEIVRKGIEEFCQMAASDYENPEWYYGLQYMTFSQIAEIKRVYQVDRLFSMEWDGWLGDEYYRYSDSEIGYL